MREVGMRCALIAVSGALVVGCSSAPPDEDPRTPSYRIAYNILHDEDADDYEIFIMNIDGREQRNLTEDPGVDWVYVARGDRMYTVSDRDDEKRKLLLSRRPASLRNAQSADEVRNVKGWRESSRYAVVLK